MISLTPTNKRRGNSLQPAPDHPRQCSFSSHVAKASKKLLATSGIIGLILASASNSDAAVITGRVSNGGTGQYLQNAVVSIQGSDKKANSERSGYYRISGLDAGTYQITARFTGLDISSQTITLTQDETLQLDFELETEIYELEAFVVSGVTEGNAFAINEQRQADNIKNVVAADTFGNLVDGNIGELMKNLPGITVDYDGEDASAIRVRGMDPALASITMDGNNVASNPGSTTRTFSLRDFAIQNIETIEISKSPTPKDPANSMGGSINFVTKSAFNQKGRKLRLDANLSLNTAALDFQKTPAGGDPSRKILPGFNLFYSEAVDTFGENHPLGIAVNVSQSSKFRFNNSYDLPSGYAYNQSDLEANEGIVSADMDGLIPSIRWRERTSLNDRQVLSLNLDFKASENTTLYLYNTYREDADYGGYSHSMRINAPVGNQTTEASFNDMIADSGVGISMSSDIGRSESSSYTINPGVRHRFGDLTISYDAYLSKAKSSPDEEFNIGVGYEGPIVGMKIENVSGNATGEITQTSGEDYLDLSNYDRLSIYKDFRPATDEQKGAKVDVRYPFVFGDTPVLFQVGGRYNQQTRIVDAYYRKYDLTGDSSLSSFGTAAEPVLQQFADPYFGSEWNFDVPVADWISPVLLNEYLKDNPDQFYDNEVRTAQRERSNSKDTKEEITAGYAMATVQLTPKFSVLTGARYEYTKLTATGVVYNGDLGSEFEEGSVEEAIAQHPYETRSKDYSRVFPNLQFKYEPVDDLIFRLAGTTNIGRPDFSAVMPGDNINDSFKLIRRNNTSLVPQEGTFYDFSAEYYLPNSGLVSFGAFYQELDNYIVDLIFPEYRPNEETGELEAWEVRTKENAGKGTNSGFELSYRQQLKWLPGELKNLEIYTAFSAAKPEAEYERRTGVLDVLGDPEDIDEYLNSPTETVIVPQTNVVEKTANMRFTYRKPKYSVSVSGNWRDDFARSLNVTTLEVNRQQSDLRFDMNFSYEVSDKWSLHLDWRNLTDVPDERSIFDRTGGFYTSGMSINLGLRGYL